MIWMIWKGSSPTKSMCIGEQSLELLLDTSHVCFSSAGLCFGLCFCASGFWACFCWYFPSFMIRSFPRLGTSCLHLTRSQESEKEIERERKREKERRPQPPFGPSVDSLCHPWFTTTNLSYRFPIFETFATALCGTTFWSASGFWACFKTSRYLK